MPPPARRFSRPAGEEVEPPPPPPPQPAYRPIGGREERKREREREERERERKRERGESNKLRGEVKILMCLRGKREEKKHL